MTTTVQQVIEGAYSRSASNDPGKLATDGEMVQVANRVYQALFALAAAAAPERYVSRTTMTLSGSPASGSLSTDIIDVRRVQKATGAKVYVIPLEEIDKTWHLSPAVYRQGGQLVSRGQSGDPVSGETLTLWQLDAPVTLANLTDVLDVRFPVRHIGLIIDELALYLSTKDDGRDAGEYAKLKASHDTNMEVFLRLSGLTLTALSSPHGGVIVQKINDLVAARSGASG